MFIGRSTTVLLIFLIVAPICGVPLAAQESDSNLSRLNDRLYAIYERNEFSQRTFDGQWLADSQRYSKWEHDSESGQRVFAVYDAATGNRSVLPNEPSDTRNANRKSPDQNHLLFQRDGNLYVRSVDDSENARPIVLRDPSRAVGYSHMQWSPDGTQILFVEFDETKVRLRSMIHPTDPSYPSVSQSRFARVGETIPAYRVGVVGRDGKQTQWLAIPSPAEGFYLGEVGWACNANEVLVEQFSRFRDQRWFHLCNVDTGEIRCIFHESDPAWVVSSTRKNVGIEWLEDGAKFVVVSEKDGWRRAYVYSRDGEPLHAITPEECDVIEKCGVDEPRNSYYYFASPDNGTQKYLYRASLDGAHPPQRVTPLDQSGTHDYQFSPDFRWAFHTWSTFDQPPTTELVEMPEHRVLRTLEDNRSLREKIAQFNILPAEFLQVDIGEGIVMDAWMLKPANFDATKKYPVLVYVYGEPHAQTVLDQWGAAQAHFHRAIAEAGYVVLSIDNRGTPCPKGAAWRRAVFGSLGPLSTEEQAAGLLAIAQQNTFIDLSRVAIWGWSGGGSNTLNAMFRKPDLYQVGIAVVPKPQPHLYNAGFQENYMRDRNVNEEGYRQSAPINFAEGLQGNLLIIHGGGETNTHLQIVEGLVDRLIELGKTFDYMVYPNRNHGLSEGKGSVVHVRLLITRYLTSHLPAGPL